jgi:hypothetical protein
MKEITTSYYPPLLVALIAGDSAGPFAYRLTKDLMDGKYNV